MPFSSKTWTILSEPSTFTSNSSLNCETLWRRSSLALRSQGDSLSVNKPMMFGNVLGHKERVGEYISRLNLEFDALVRLGRGVALIFDLAEHWWTKTSAWATSEIFQTRFIVRHWVELTCETFGRVYRFNSSLSLMEL